jgi:hypothetical protein
MRIIFQIKKSPVLTVSQDEAGGNGSRYATTWSTKSGIMSTTSAMSIISKAKAI